MSDPVVCKIYGRTSAHQGVKEDLTKCTDSLWDKFLFRDKQCSRARKYGPKKTYCLQHWKRNQRMRKMMKELRKKK